ncbi:MAG: cytochrome c-type biogenesis protein CcmH [Magnetococcales bacterium]|nr:cytochrome c-type biogenesis protein CcmH [Magnetococcales bacterium]
MAQINNMKRFLQAVTIFAILLITTSPLSAKNLNEDPSEALVRTIAKDLRCAVCQNQSVYESNSDLAKDMLEVIRDKVKAGDSEASIRDYFFQRYGDYIYLEPTKSGMNMLLWFGPILGLIIGGLALISAFKKWKKNSVKVEKPKNEDDKKMQARIDEELKDIEV